MKINEKLGLCLMVEDLYISLLFTLRASRRLPSAALLRACNSFTMAAPLSALHMKASNSCKIQVLNNKKKPRKTPSGELSPPGVFNDYKLTSEYRMDASKAKKEASKIKIPT
jgi:hypothetical protein